MFSFHEVVRMFLIILIGIKFSLNNILAIVVGCLILSWVAIFIIAFVKPSCNLSIVLKIFNFTNPHSLSIKMKYTLYVWLHLCPLFL